MNTRSWHVCVLIPACNEEHLLPRCLFSVKAAACYVVPVASVDIILAVDHSTDQTRLLGERILIGCGTVVCTSGAIVGRARAAAARTALQRYRGPLNLCWLANTDADSRVPLTWLNDQLALADRGVEAITGTIEVDSFCEHGPLVEGRFRRSYSIRQDGSHSHVHGANFGVRADVYVRAGGCTEITTAEDHDLWNRLAQIGARRVSVSHSRVITSGRRIGRAPHGFAHTLAAHNWTSP